MRQGEDSGEPPQVGELPADVVLHPVLAHQHGVYVTLLVPQVLKHSCRPRIAITKIFLKSGDFAGFVFTASAPRPIQSISCLY